MIRIKTYGAFACFALLVAMVLALSGPAAAKKPDCNNDPTHPSCGDDGGGGDGDAACLESTTFPAFSYFGLSGPSQPNGIYLSDETGACMVQVSDFGGACLLGDTAAHYTPPSSPGDVGVGRVVSVCWDDGHVWEYTVAADNSVSVVMDNIPFSMTLEDDGERITALDLAPDGDTLAFNVMWSDTDGSGAEDGTSIYIASLQGCIADVFQHTDPDTCSGTATEILQIPHTYDDNEVTRFSDGMVWSDDGQRLYLVKKPDVRGSGIYVMEEESPGDWSLSLITPSSVFGDQPYRPAATTTDLGDGDTDVLAFRLTLNDGMACSSRIHVLDVESCRADNSQCDSIAPYIPGARAGFTNDGLLVFNAYDQKGKRTCNNNDKIAIMDPFTLGSSPTKIADGSHPQGH